MIYIILICLIIFLVRQFQIWKFTKEKEFTEIAQKITLLKNTNNYLEMLITIDEIRNLIENINTKKFSKALKFDFKQKKKNQIIGYSSIDELYSFLKYRERFALNLKKIEDKTNAVIEELEDLKNYEISIKTDAKKTKKPLYEMPEIKLQPIGKKFNIAAKLTNFIVVDVETTGLSAGKNQIIELSAIKFCEFEPIEKFTSLIHIKSKLPEEITEITEITDDMLLGQPELHQIKDSFIHFIGESPIVGYNIPFDIKFLFAADIDLTNHKIYDVYQLAKKLLSNDEYYFKSDFKLSSVAQYYGIYFPAHRSLYDCYATGTVLKHLLDDFIE